MPLYENIYIKLDSEFASQCLSVHESSVVSGEPDITLTSVRDASLSKDSISSKDFLNVISIGKNNYIESLDRLAFHCGKVKLTSVKLNDREAGKIIIGNDVVLQGTAIIAYDCISIGNNVVFGPNVTVMDSSGHPLCGRGKSDEASRITSAPVEIQEHAWIGIGAIILKGVKIGKHAVIGAGSVVASDIPDYALAIGNPARVVKLLPQEHVENI